jgi:cytochrome c oxidase subunit 2
MTEFLQRWMPVDGSAHGAELDHMTGLLHWLMAVLFVGWGLYFIYVLFRFRAGANPKASYTGVKSHFSSYIEIGVVVAEVIILVAFAIPAWARWVTPHDPTDDPLVVRVVGQQFAWNVHYSGADGVFGPSDPHLVDESTNPIGLDRSGAGAQDDVVTINQLHLPVDRPVTLLLSTKDVIHSFFLPTMRGKQDAIPGMEIPVHFKPVMTTPEESKFPACAAARSCWEIACSQLCGLGHYRMRGYFMVHEEAEFDAWLGDQVASSLAEFGASTPAAEGDAPATEPAAMEEAHEDHEDHATN